MNGRQEREPAFVAIGVPWSVVLLGIMLYGIVRLLMQAKDGADLVFALAALVTSCAVSVTFRRWLGSRYLPVLLAKMLGTIFGLVALFCAARYAWSTVFDGHRVTWDAVHDYSRIPSVVVGFSVMALYLVVPMRLPGGSLQEDRDRQRHLRRQRINRVTMIVFWLYISVRCLTELFALDLPVALLATAAAAVAGVLTLVPALVNRRRARRGVTKRAEPSLYLPILSAFCLVIIGRGLWWLVGEGRRPLQADRVLYAAIAATIGVLTAYLAFSYIGRGVERRWTLSQAEDINSSIAGSDRLWLG